MADKKEIKILERLKRIYKIEDGKVERLKKICPNCGRYMAEHADRYHCGYCGYTEYKKQPQYEELRNIGIKIKK